jgi:hypothetical protein
LALPRTAFLKAEVRTPVWPVPWTEVMPTPPILSCALGSSLPFLPKELSTTALAVAAARRVVSASCMNGTLRCKNKSPAPTICSAIPTLLVHVWSGQGGSRTRDGGSAGKESAEGGTAGDVGLHGHGHAAAAGGRLQPKHNSAISIQMPQLRRAITRIPSDMSTAPRWFPKMYQPFPVHAALRTNELRTRWRQRRQCSTPHTAGGVAATPHPASFPPRQSSSTLCVSCLLRACDTNALCVSRRPAATTTWVLRPLPMKADGAEKAAAEATMAEATTKRGMLADESAAKEKLVRMKIFVFFFQKCCHELTAPRPLPEAHELVGKWRPRTKEARHKKQS